MSDESVTILVIDPESRLITPLNAYLDRMRTERVHTARRRRRVLTLGAVLAGAALLIAGCSGSSADSAGVEEMAPAAFDDGSMGDGSMAGGDMASEAPQSAVDEEGRSLNDEVTADSDRQVIVTGWVTVVVDDPIEKASRVVTTVESVRGYIQARSQQSAGEGRNAYASLTARVPADRLQEVIDELDGIGAVEQAQLDSVEVTAQARDLDARIRAMEISIERLEALLERTGDLSDIVQAEQVLTERQSELEQLQSQRAALADQVAMSTLTINLYTDEAVPDEPPRGFMTGLESGWKALVSFARWIATAVGVLLPWLLPAAVVTLVAWPLLRRRRRSSAAQKVARDAARGPMPSGRTVPPTPAQPTAQAHAAPQPPSPDTSGD